MIDHISIEVSSLARSRAFYDAVLAPLGYRCLWATAEATGYGASGKDEPFAIKATSETVALRSNLRIPITAKNRANVKTFYEAAIESGGHDDGAAVPAKRLPDLSSGWRRVRR